MSGALGRPTPPTRRPIAIALRDAWRSVLALVARLRAPPRVPPPKRQRASGLSRADVHALGSGEFYFKDEILDQLDSYFVILERMKRGDREAYDYFSQVGATIVPTSAEVEIGTRVPPRFAAQMPSMGSVVLCGAWLTGMERRGKMIHPRMFYFTKYRRRAFNGSFQQPRKGCAGYIVTVYWDCPEDDRWREGAPSQFGVEVDPDGSVRPLRDLATKQTIRPRRGKSFQVPDHRWGRHPFWTTWAREAGRDPEEFLRFMFLLAVNFWESASEGSMTRISASKGELTATFALNIIRTPYFFSDRDIADARRRKIFHIVRTHTRQLATGKTSNVRTHFRGEREFDWNGYKILITVPGWHHVNLNYEFNIKSDLHEPERIDKGVLDSRGLGAWASGIVRGERDDLPAPHLRLRARR